MMELKKQIMQFDILKPGTTYKVIVDEGSRYERRQDMELLKCLKDYYLFLDDKGRKESFLKCDLINGSWKVEGINPKKLILEAAGKMQEAKAADKDGEVLDEVKEEVERIVKKNMEKMVGDCLNWLESHPGEEMDVREVLSQYSPNQYYVDKVRDEVIEKLGSHLTITDGKPKKLILKTEKTQENEELPDEEEEEETLKYHEQELERQSEYEEGYSILPEPEFMTFELVDDILANILDMCKDESIYDKGPIIQGYIKGVKTMMGV